MPRPALGEVFFSANRIKYQAQMNILPNKSTICPVLVEIV